ncbi:metallophosphoesterase [Halohasta salina]|uniref:metallophosphoesterase n=1 Tax=Halohasta salina TaxID=2961621 RepID=UPI0020A23591|nr:metallophosphoesterase [Halohasta salina]
MFQLPDPPLDDSLRDGVDALADEAADPPTIVSISDIHGYLEAARSALLTLADHPEFAPVVTEGDDGRLHWADENYVLVFNGDLVDRGPANEGVLALVARLIEEAPPGRVRLTLGNHEALALSPDQFGFDEWYSGQLDDDARRRLCEAIVDGHVVAAYEGYAVTYAHAGADEPYDVSAVNESLVAAAADLRKAIGTDADVATQGRIVTDYPQVLGVGRNHLKGPEAGLVWLHFDHLSVDAPPQVVGHTRHDEPTTKGGVHCQNVLQETVDTPGGEAVFVETPTGVSALVRRSDSGVEIREPPF